MHAKVEDDAGPRFARPSEAGFVVAFDKARGAYGPAVASFVAQLGTDGWTVESATEHREASSATS